MPLVLQTHCKLTPAEATLLRWKATLAASNPDNARLLASWTEDTQPCNPQTLATSWAGLTCVNITVQPGQRRPGIEEM